MNHFSKLQMLFSLYHAIYTIGHMPHDHGISSSLHKELDNVRTETIRSMLVAEIEETITLIARQGTT